MNQFFTLDIESVSSASSHDPYDVVIVGGGPAGLQCAVYALSEGLSVCLIEGGKIGGQIRRSPLINNLIPHGSGINGLQFAGEAAHQLIAISQQCTGRFAAVNAFATHIERYKSSQRFNVTVANRRESSKRIIVGKTVVMAMGMYVDEPDNLFTDMRHDDIVTSNDGAHSHRMIDKAVVIGGGNSACQTALFLAEISLHPVTMIVRSDLNKSASDYLINQVFRCGDERIKVWQGYTIGNVEQYVPGRYRAALIPEKRTDAHGDAQVVFDKLYYMGSSLPANSCAPREVITGEGFIAAKGVRTSIKGLFVCGDIRSGQTRRVAIAMGSGSAVVDEIHKFFATGDWE